MSALDVQDDLICGNTTFRANGMMHLLAFYRVGTKERNQHVIHLEDGAWAGV